MQQIFDESNSMKLTTMADDFINKYVQSLPKPNSHAKFDHGQGPTDLLNQAIYCYATAIKGKKTDANLHYKLGLVLEEKYYTEDLLGLKKDGVRILKMVANVNVVIRSLNFSLHVDI